MERFFADGVVLSTLDYGEADRLVTLFTRERGKLTAFAAGARKSRRRFAGALEPFTRVRAQLCERRGDTLRLDGADIQASYPSIRQDLPLIARALYGVELCRELVQDREAHPELFALLVDYLERLSQAQAGPSSLLLFELQVLAQVGLMPRFDACALCGRDTGERPLFDPSHGGVTCEVCSPRARFGVTVSPRVVEALRNLQRGARVPLPPEARRKGRELLNHFIAHQLGRKLHSVDFMAQLGLD